MPYPSILKMTFTDANSKSVVSQVYLSPGASDSLYSSIISAVEAGSLGHMSLAVIRRPFIGPSFAPGTSGPYGTNRDVAVLQFSFSDNCSAELAVPCPNASCFIGSTTEVDPAGPLSGLISLFVANGYNLQGATCTGYLQGWRAKAPNIG